MELRVECDEIELAHVHSRNLPMVSRLRLYTQVIRYAIAGAMGMLVGAAVLSSNLNERKGITGHSNLWAETEWFTNSGWPLVACHQSYGNPRPLLDGEPPELPWHRRRLLSRSVHWPRAAMNATAGMLLAISTSLAILLATKNGLQPRFSLKTLFGVVTIAGLLIALAQYERNKHVLLYVFSWQDAVFYPASLLPWWICISLFFGMACALYVTGWLSAVAAGRIVGRRATS